MALMTFIEAIRDTLADEMRRDESGHRAGRGRRQEGRRLPGHRRAVGRVRRRPGDRHAADRVDDRRRLDRRRRQRPAAGGRDPVRRLHPPGLQPDRVRGGPDALPLEQRGRRADDDPGAIRRRRPRRALPLAVGRGVLHPRARVSRSSCRRPRTTPGACSRSSIRDDDPVLFFEHKKMYRSVRGDVPDGDFVVPARPGPGDPPGLAGHGRSPTG